MKPELTTGVLNAERLAQVALKELGMDPSVGGALDEALQRFTEALPGIQHMRNGLMHFDEWALGKGHGPQQQRVNAGAARRDVAREHWGFGYEQISGTVSLGPHTINVDTADRAAAELSYEIYLAAHEVDKSDTAELLVNTIDALTTSLIQLRNASDGIPWRKVPDHLRRYACLRHTFTYVNIIKPNLRAAVRDFAGDDTIDLVPCDEKPSTFPLDTGAVDPQNAVTPDDHPSQLQDDL